ncbi:MAG TPA: TrbI/VirB10 family protein [Terriglobia bacterium]|nr:TrbI/VirB10 family protein [Terriglobia bacterium]
MDESENRDQEPEKQDTAAESIGEVELNAATQPQEAEEETKPGLMEIFRKNFQSAWQGRRPAQKKPSRKELKKDKSKSLLALGAFVAAMLLMFVFVFSAPEKRKPLNQAATATPDLGQRVTPGEKAQAGRVTPLLDVTPATNDQGNNSTATPQDVAQTARPVAKISAGNDVSAPRGGANRTLADVSFSERALDEQYAMHGTNPPPVQSATATATGSDDLDKASLVFVRAEMRNRPAAATHPAVESESSSVMDALPVGTRLIARLQAPVSTAVAAPVVAVIEYNYEQDGEIILPAGSQVTGKLQNATSQGYVSLHFDRLELPDGTTQKIDAGAMGLDYKPLTGYVNGRNRGLKFLVQSLTGVGEVAAYMVGGSPSNTSVFSEDALLREQMANNVAIAGQNQFNQLAFNQHVVVTVPGNTRFYLVLEQGTSPASAPAGFRSASNSPAMNLTSNQEQEELMELKRELAAMYQQANGEISATNQAQQ